MIKININSLEELLQTIEQRPERYVKVKIKTDFKEKGSYIMVDIDKNQEELKEIRNLRIFALVVFVLFMTAGYIMSKKKDNFYPSYLSYYLN